MKTYGRYLGWTLASITLWGCVTGTTRSATPFFPEAGSPSKPTRTVSPAPTKSPIAAAFSAATTAAEQAGSATTSTAWNEVALAWADAIQHLQAIPTGDPEWLFAQRKIREYLDNQAIALQQAEETGAPVIFPTLGNDILDEQVGVYLSYIATFGPPDVLVIGSSRALQGINPQVLQQRLDQQGLESVQVYTFAVNGATAQVVSFILRQLLTPEQLPRMIIWAGGSRSFNSARFDRTFAKILESPGYTAVRTGDRPEIGEDDSETAPAATNPENTVPTTSINGYGFLSVNEVFNPAAYYRQFPRVLGLYDSAYRPFALDGVQTASFRAIAGFARGNNIPLVFVNLPLSDDYLDATRLRYEQQFQQYLQAEANSGGFTVVDLLQAWPGQDQLFADPSHLNRYGAAQVAIALSESTAIPWQRLNDSEASREDTPADSEEIPDSTSTPADSEEIPDSTSEEE